MGGLLLFAVLIFFAISPPLTNLVGVYNSQRFTEVISLAVLCLASPPKAYPERAMGLGILLFFATGLVSVSLAAHPYWASIEYFRFILLFALAFRIASTGETAQQHCCYALSATALLCLVKVSIGILVTSRIGGGIAAVADAFSNHRHFAEFFVALESFLALFLLNSKKRHLALLAIIPIAVSTIVILMGSGRASATALLASAVVYIYISDKEKIQSTAILTIAIITGWLIYKLWIFQPIDRAILRQGDSGRLELWSLGIKHWLENILFGLGPMHYASIPNSIAAHPHNLIVQILSEWGILAFCAIIGFFMILFSKLRSINQSENNIAVPAICALIGLLASAMFGGVLVVPAVEFLFFVLLGIGMTSSITKWNNANAVAVAVRISALILCLLCFLSWTWQASDTPRGAPTDAPRFWQNGGLPLLLSAP